MNYVLVIVYLEIFYCILILLYELVCYFNLYFEKLDMKVVICVFIELIKILGSIN